MRHIWHSFLSKCKSSCEAWAAWAVQNWLTSYFRSCVPQSLNLVVSREAKRWLWDPFHNSRAMGRIQQKRKHWLQALGKKRMQHSLLARQIFRTSPFLWQRTTFPTFLLHFYALIPQMQVTLLSSSLPEDFSHNRTPEQQQPGNTHVQMSVWKASLFWTV